MPTWSPMRRCSPRWSREFDAWRRGLGADRLRQRFRSRHAEARAKLAGLDWQSPAALSRRSFPGQPAGTQPAGLFARYHRQLVPASRLPDRHSALGDAIATAALVRRADSASARKGHSHPGRGRARLRALQRNQYARIANRLARPVARGAAHAKPCSRGSTVSLPPPAARPDEQPAAADRCLDIRPARGTGAMLIDSQGQFACTSIRPIPTGPTASSPSATCCDQLRRQGAEAAFGPPGQRDCRVSTAKPARRKPLSIAPSRACDA